MLQQIKRDPDTTANAAKAPENNFDAESFKNEITNSTKTMLEQALTSIKSMVDGYASGVESAKNSTSNHTDEGHRTNLISEFSEELEALGITDQTQANALLSLLDKQLQKRAPEFKTDVVNAVSENQTRQELKAKYDNETVQKFPQATNPSSDLHKLASEIYKNMGKELKKEPDAQAIAVERAAKRLGIEPLMSVELSYSTNAANDTRGSGGKGGGKGKTPEIDSNFAKLFNVNPEAVSKKLAQINTKH